ncbi:MAG: hypothetical protein AB8B52_11895 [Winogradskyella sp.]|uniref:hypothetical protein n=1 Tax=Winogradskyella sp. TaxID=1883156 RepID=UPI00385F70B3
MKKIVLIIFTLFLGINTYGQMQRGGRGQMNRMPQTNTEPTEQEIEKRKRDMEERKEEYIDNFILTLEGDEFQKHIVKQNITSFFDAKLAIFKTPFEHSLDRKKAIENLENTHFKELEELISESDMSKIKELIKGDFKEKEVVKEKKKRRKKKKKKKDDG